MIPQRNISLIANALVTSGGRRIPEAVICAQEYPCRTRFDENLPGTGSFSRARRHEKTGQLIRNYEHVVPLQLFIVHNKLIIKEIKLQALNMG